MTLRNTISHCSYSWHALLKPLVYMVVNSRSLSRVSWSAVYFKPWKEIMIMREHILGRHTAELDEQGTLTLYGPELHMALPYDEAYALLRFLDENHRDTLFTLVQDDQKSALYVKNLCLVVGIPLLSGGQDEHYGLY